MPRRLMARIASLNKTQNTLAKINRIGFDHGKSPPWPTESAFKTKGNPLAIP
jgi:hypothetical protein